MFVLCTNAPEHLVVLEPNIGGVVMLIRASELDGLS